MSNTYSSTDDFAYDVFLSYRHIEPCLTWVRKTLLESLEAENLRVCIDFRDFRLGELLIPEMTRAVLHSRYTIAVLTPEYQESGFTELESVMAEHLGLQNKQRRLLIVMRQYCQPRLSIQSRIWLDMIDDNQFPTQFTRLVHEICQPLDR